MRCEASSRAFRSALCFALLLSSGALAACGRLAPALHASAVELAPKPNRAIEWESVWNAAKPLRVEIKQPLTNEPPRYLDLRAIHDGSSVEFLAIWRDPTPSSERRVWLWDKGSKKYFLRETPTDSFSMKFRLTGSPDACMMSGEEGTYDLWQWRGGWSEIFGLAEDRTLAITRDSPASADATAYPMPGKQPPIFISFKDDAGDPIASPVAMPREYKGGWLHADEPRKGQGSTTDVLAEGFHLEGEWRLELMRALQTGHADDYQFTGRGPHLFAISVHEGAQGQKHFTSGLIRLYLD